MAKIEEKIDQFHHNIQASTPEELFRVLKEVPDDWLVFGAELIYMGDNPNLGCLEYERGEPRWIDISLENVFNKKNLFPSKIEFKKDFVESVFKNGHWVHEDIDFENSNFFSKTKKLLIPSAIENGYKLRYFEVFSGLSCLMKTNLDRRTTLKCYTPEYLYGIYSSFDKKSHIYCDHSEKGIKEVMLFEKYFLD